MTLSPELAQWRKALRASLIARRVAASVADHARWSAARESLLMSGFPVLKDLAMGICWPFQAEFDARPLAVKLLGQGARAALPVVIAKAQPLVFREWFPDCPMTQGAYDLPIPDGTPLVRPTALLVPVVGIGKQGDRLGYGGGFFDRTLAALQPQPLSIALAFELSRVETTDPQPHDILMDFVVTECGIQMTVPGGLQMVTPSECAMYAEALVVRRQLRAFKDAAPSVPA